MSDSANVHVDALCETLDMKSRSPEKSSNVRDVKVSDADISFPLHDEQSRQHKHEGELLDHSCRQRGCVQPFFSADIDCHRVLMLLFFALGEVREASAGAQASPRHLTHCTQPEQRNLRLTAAPVVQGRPSS